VEDSGEAMHSSVELAQLLFPAICVYSFLAYLTTKYLYEFRYVSKNERITSE
jgi:CRISPR/Cas system CMR subunit Cmr4 (Cas7 group RAMP superfamily)